MRFARYADRAGHRGPLTIELAVRWAGLRISEALRLTRRDVDLNTGVLTVVQTKFQKSRLVPLHPTTTHALRRYARQRDRRHPRASRAAAFFLTERGTTLKYWRTLMTFTTLRTQLGWTGPRGQRPRLHDLRHTFAVRRLIRWHRRGVDLHHRIAALSTYLGHVKVTDTYWYLTAVPELLAITGRQYERFACGSQRGVR